MAHGMEQLSLRDLLGLPAAAQVPEDDPKKPDSSETVHISALALIKMMKHARSGVPLEVMGILLGNFVDDYTIQVIDTFCMPQRGSAATVESFDPAYQARFMELLKYAGRQESAVGWYHSHPGFGCWLSPTDLETQQLMEKLHGRCIAIVIDPTQSVKGKVVIDAFRSIDPMKMAIKPTAFSSEPRQITSNTGHVNRLTMSTAARGVGTKYYSLAIDFNCLPKEQKMLLSFTNKNWRQALQIVYPSYLDKNNMTHLEEMTKIFKSYNEELESGRLMTKREGEVQKYGRLNTKHQLKMMSNSMLASNIMQMLGAIVNMKTTEEAVKAKAEANKKMARVSLRSSFHVSHDNATTPVADRNSPNAQSQTTNEQPRQSKKKENNSINRK